MNSIDIDTGGTFTDGVFCLDGSMASVKVETTPHDPVRCFVDCIEAGASLLGTDTAALLRQVNVIRYSTTAATNTIIQRKGTKVGLLVTEGAEKALYSANAGSPQNLTELVDQSLVRGVQEEVDARGIVQRTVDTESFRSAADQLLDAGARLLVVAFRHATINPANELQARDLFRSWFPSHYLGTPFLLLSHEVSPRGGDAERLHSAFLSGYLHRALVSYLYRCDEVVRSLGFRRPLLVVHSTGGLARVAKTKALHTYNSGPTAGVFGAARLAQQYGLNHVVTMDMGGTSTDVAFIEKGAVRVSLGGEIGGLRVSVPMVEVVSMGGGGGSIASLEQGKLRVGPESVGSVPGPACYDLGSTAPTVTDADVVLGLIAPENFLGGRRRIQVELARKALAKAVAGPLGLSVEEAALKIRRVLAETLALAIRYAAGRNSFALSEAVLFAYGGAGPVHAADIAEELGIRTYYVFPHSPVFSAAGSSAMNVEHYYESRVRPRNKEGFIQAVRRVLAATKGRALRDIRGEGFDPSRAQLRWIFESLEGKEWEIDPEADPETQEWAREDDGLIRLTATLETAARQSLEMPSPSTGGWNGGSHRREVRWPAGRQQTLIHWFGAVGRGKWIAGPAEVETGETSCVIPPGWVAAKDQYGALVVSKERN